ncbi:TLC domain-containing protein 4-A-like [Dreissena polymorpha]|uniref:TLC domain-containing protein n=1 Tax=Dreissena polymorpha TaxID=45954 RepID=A0A9D3YDQ7_DREPO|nr:TLC domain-containing protein 4-A-like [Dreissena polymorpha]KAH3698510.1 hypothetical protein DPMN_086032 [Dreissena polymorpha]
MEAGGTGARPHELKYDPSYVLYGGGASFLLNIILFRLVSPVVSGCLVPAYRTLSIRDRMDWNDRFISNINAALAIAMSAHTLFYEDALSADKVWHDSYVARLACGIIAGYMLADVICMLTWCHVGTGELLGFMFHHAATVYAYYFISAYGVLCYFGMLRLIAEVSTPPVNQRWFFDILDVPRSNCCVLLNGMLMVATFFFFRMVTMPIYWYQIWLVTGTDAVLTLGHIQLIMYIPCFVLDALNLYWFYKMCRGFIKAIKGLKKPVANNSAKFKTL